MCCKCPHYYSGQSYDGEYDWGCRIFGDECNSCPSFWDDEGDADETEMGGTCCRRREANGEAVPASWCGGLSFPPSAPSAPYPHKDRIIASVGGRR